MSEVAENMRALILSMLAPPQSIREPMRKRTRFSRPVFLAAIPKPVNLTLADRMPKQTTELKFRDSGAAAGDSAFAETRVRLAVVTIDLAGCTEITDLAVQTIAFSCPRLKTINLTGCESVTESGLLTLALSKPGISAIRMHECPARENFLARWPEYIACNDTRVMTDPGEIGSPRKYAMVIGISEYCTQNRTPMCRNDATAMTLLLRNSGFTVVTNRKPACDIREFRRLFILTLSIATRRRYTKDSVFLFYFAGHGFSEGSFYGPCIRYNDAKANGDMRCTMSDLITVSIKTIHEMTTQCLPGIRDIFVMDACRISGPYLLKRMAPGDEMIRDHIPKSIHTSVSENEIYIVYTTSRGKSASEFSPLNMPHGVWMSYFISVISAERAPISFGRALYLTAIKMSDGGCKQTPAFASNAYPMKKIPIIMLNIPQVHL